MRCQWYAGLAGYVVKRRTVVHKGTFTFYRIRVFRSVVGCVFKDPTSMMNCHRPFYSEPEPRGLESGSERSTSLTRLTSFPAIILEALYYGLHTKWCVVSILGIHNFSLFKYSDQ